MSISPRTYLPQLKTIRTFQSTIFSRYEEYQRSFPRREEPTPYNVFLSEIMSQQTQVARVVPKFLTFKKKVPDFVSLSQLDNKTLLSLRSGLGFNARALRMQQSATIIAQKYNSIVPKDQQVLLGLPGIGPYTSAAILAFAYNIDVPVVDINIKRVLIHSFGLTKDLSDRDVTALAAACVPTGQSRDRHNALMDYGALVLTGSKTGITSTKQSKFVGSKRQVRGNILKYLVAHGSTDVDKLQKLYPHKEFDAIVMGLEKEGFIVRKENILAL